MFGAALVERLVRRLGLVAVGLVVSVAVFVGLGGVASADSGDGSLSVGTGYAHEGVEDLIWATEHMGYESPADLQKTGVLVIRFILIGHFKSHIFINISPCNVISISFNSKKKMNLFKLH